MKLTDSPAVRAVISATLTAILIGAATACFLTAHNDAGYALLAWGGTELWRAHDTATGAARAKGD